MGCCFGTPTMGNINVKGPDRAAAWKTTGIVGLRDANLTKLPSSILELTSVVRTLDATNNKLVTLPEELEKLKGLQRLLLGGNRLQSLSPAVGSLKALKVLVLDTNCLFTLPAEVGMLPQLERLSVASNFLQTLPDTIGNLAKLTLLDVRSNKLTELPAALGNCQALEELLAPDNDISELPDSLAELRHLHSLKVDNNRIRKLPATLLVGCVALQTISLHGNSFSIGDLQGMEGYEAFETRRRNKVDKQIAGNVMMTSSHLDEGVDRQLLSTSS